jgi:hypothetical protein
VGGWAKRKRQIGMSGFAVIFYAWDRWRASTFDIRWRRGSSLARDLRGRYVITKWPTLNQIRCIGKHPTLLLGLLLDWVGQ